MSAIKWFIAELACITSVVAAALLCYYEKSGWGWFIFLALATAVTSFKDSNS